MMDLNPNSLSYYLFGLDWLMARSCGELFAIHVAVFANLSPMILWFCSHYVSSID